MQSLLYHIGRLSEEEALRLDFSDGLLRRVNERIELGFIPMQLPVINEEPYRIFNSTKEYRQWADQNLPKWLSYYCSDD
jgi:hypothetical protein